MRHLPSPVHSPHPSIQRPRPRDGERDPGLRITCLPPFAIALMRAAFCLLPSAFCLLTYADDWPQWRGPSRDGLWRETGIVDTLPASGVPVRWRVKVGAGYAGPVVAQGRVFVTDHLFDPEVERVVCFEEGTGKQLWVHAYPCN